LAFLKKGPKGGGEREGEGFSRGKNSLETPNRIPYSTTFKIIYVYCFVRLSNTFPPFRKPSIKVRMVHSKLVFISPLQFHKHLVIHIYFSPLRPIQSWFYHYHQTFIRLYFLQLKTPTSGLHTRLLRLF
jgi:hypothetical protein